MYQAKLASVPDALIFFWLFSSIKRRRLRPPAKFARYITENLMYPDNFPGLGRGLDFLLILFLHQGKKRRPSNPHTYVHLSRSQTHRLCQSTGDTNRRLRRTPRPQRTWRNRHKSTLFLRTQPRSHPWQTRSGCQFTCLGRRAPSSRRSLLPHQSRSRHHVSRPRPNHRLSRLRP